MPAVAAHYHFGRLAAENASNLAKGYISEHIEMFALGTQGPDLLFYHKPLKKNAVAEHGHELHRQSAADFFAPLWQNRSVWSPAQIAYLMGFCCHYALDRACHPKVNLDAPTSVEHQRLESAFDMIVLTRFARPLQRGGLVPSGRVDISALGAIYTNMSHEQIERAVSTFARFTHLLDFSLPAVIAERVMGKPDKFSTLCMPKSLPIGHKAESLIPLFDEAIAKATALIDLLLDKRCTQADLELLMAENFEGVLPE